MSKIVQLAQGIQYYGYTVMTLAYLSQLDPPVIPNLQHINQNDPHDECYVDICISKEKYGNTIYQQGQEIGIATRIVYNLIQLNHQQSTM